MFLIKKIPERIPTAKAIIDSGWIANRKPRVVAMPFPPVNFKYGE